MDRSNRARTRADLIYQPQATCVTIYTSINQDEIKFQFFSHTGHILNIPWSYVAMHWETENSTPPASQEVPPASTALEARKRGLR